MDYYLSRKSSVELLKEKKEGNLRAGAASQGGKETSAGQQDERLMKEDAADDSAAKTAVEEVLYGIDLTSESLIITVATGGCTEKGSFHVDVDKGYTGRPPYLVTVYRVKSDDCEGDFEPIRISFSRRELGLEGAVDFRVLNRIGSISQHRLKPS